MSHPPATAAVCQSPTILVATRTAPSAAVRPFTWCALQRPTFEPSTANERPQETTQTAILTVPWTYLCAGLPEGTVQRAPLLATLYSQHLAL